MKILITGSAGFVGKFIFNYLKSENQLYGISRRSSETTTHSFDISNIDISRILNEIAPDVIIHSAALTNVDYSEEHQDEAWKTNVFGTENLVKWCKENDKKMIYISTDYVYSGEKNNYDEYSETNPVNYYGKTKLEAENLVKDMGDKFHYINIFAAHNPRGWGLDITATGATKQIALLEWAKLNNLTREEIVGVGDSYNDYSLLTAAGIVVAMGNAVDELKEIADFIAPTQEDSGILEVINKYF